MFELNQSHATGQTVRPFKRDDGRQEIFAVSKFESSDYLQRKKKDIALSHLGSFSTGVFGIAFTA